MKTRSELREIIMKIIYQISIYEESNLEYNLKEMISEQLEVENDFINTTIEKEVVLPYEESIEQAIDELPTCFLAQ